MYFDVSDVVGASSVGLEGCTERKAPQQSAGKLSSGQKIIPVRESNWIQEHLAYRGKSELTASEKMTKWFVARGAHALYGVGSLVAAPLALVAAPITFMLADEPGVAMYRKDKGSIDRRVLTQGVMMGGGLLVAKAYKNIVWAVNPGANFYPQGEKTLVKAGVVFSLLAPRIAAMKKADARTNSTFWGRNLRRLEYVGVGLAAVVFRGADALIAVVAVPLSLLTFGMLKPVNQCALRSVHSAFAVHDLYLCLMKVIDPSCSLEVDFYKEIQAGLQSASPQQFDLKGEDQVSDDDKGELSEVLEEFDPNPDNSDALVIG